MFFLFDVVSRGSIASCYHFIIDPLIRTIFHIYIERWMISCQMAYPPPGDSFATSLRSPALLDARRASRGSLCTISCQMAYPPPGDSFATSLRSPALLVARRASRGSQCTKSCQMAYPPLGDSFTRSTECSNTCLHHPTCPQTPSGNFFPTYLPTNSAYISHKTPKMTFFAFATM